MVSDRPGGFGGNDLYISTRVAAMTAPAHATQTGGHVMRHAALRTTAAGLFAGLFAAVASGQGAPAQTLNDSFDSTAPFNPVLEWNQIFIDTLIATTPPNIASPRLGAIVQAAVFDAYNGIEQRYAPLFVARRAPDGASPEAAVIAAAYTTLVGLFPSQQAAVLDPAYGASLEALREHCPTGPRPNGAPRLRDAHPGWPRLGRRRRARDPGHARQRRLQRQLPGLRRRHGHRSVAADAAGVRTDERPEPGLHRHVRPGEQHPVPAGATADACAARSSPTISMR